ncbi:MAG: outer membrane protein assembly factor BamD [Planctomycetota bacterium]
MSTPRSVPCLLLVLAAACSSAPQEMPATAQEALERAEQYLQGGQPGAAKQLLLAVDPRSYRGRALERYEVALARAQLGDGDLYDAYKSIKQFPREHGDSPLLKDAETIEFQAGARLAARGGGFLGLWTDLGDAEAILEHFIVEYPASVYLDDALRILGEAAYQQQNWTRAIARFRELLEQGQDSEWREWAEFRFAMAHYRLVNGPDYDLGALELARRELAGYLAGGAKDQAHLEEARAALSRVLFWLESKHMRIARFYRRIGSGWGALRAAEKVLENPETPFGEEARGIVADAKELIRAGSSPEPRDGKTIPSLPEEETQREAVQR